MPRADEEEFLRTVLQNDYWAIDYCQTVFRISQTLDDLIDKDRPMSDAVIIETFWNALIRLPNNEFYKRHMGTLVPMMQVFLQDWMDATRLERGTEHEKDISFVLRDTIGGLVIHIAHLVGGYEWAITWAPAVRRHIHEDSRADYKRELGT